MFRQETIHKIPLALLLITSTLAMAQPFAKSAYVQDMKQDWQVLGADSLLQRYTGQTRPPHTIYFAITNKQVNDHYLYIHSRNPISLFLNHRILTCQKQSILLDLDSLAKIYSSPWLFGLYQRKGSLTALNTLLISPTPSVQSAAGQPRTPPYFMNFAIITMLILFAFLAILLQHHRQLTLDYLNPFKAPLLQGQKKLPKNLILDQAHILHYLFSSLLFAFVLLTLFHYAAEKIPAALYFPVRSTSEAFYQWIKLSGIIMGLLIVKLIIVGLLSALFDFKGSLTIQIYEYIKTLLVVAVVAGMMCLVYFVTKTKNPEAYHLIAYGIACILLLFWPAVVGIKLSHRSSRSYSHIFSYLCVSEFIPIIVIVQALAF